MREGSLTLACLARRVVSRRCCSAPWPGHSSSVVYWPKGTGGGTSGPDAFSRPARAACVHGQACLLF
ncbi:unnamed protein product, partial [Ixodes pacificus]